MSSWTPDGKLEKKDNTEDDSITVDLHGGAVDFNRKMFKDEAAWEDFKSKALEQAHARDLSRMENFSENVSDPARRKAWLERPEGMSREEFSKAYETSQEQKRKAELSDHVKSVNNTTRQRENVRREYAQGTSRVGPARFVERGLLSAAEQAAPEDPGYQPVAFDETAPAAREQSDAGTRYVGDRPDPLNDSPLRPTGVMSGPADRIPGGVPDAGAAPVPEPDFPSWIDTRSPINGLESVGRTAGQLVGPAAPPAAPPPSGSTPPPPDQSAPPPAAAPAVPAGPGVGLEKPETPEQLKAKYDALGAHYKEAVRTAADIEAYRADVGQSTARKAEQHAIDAVARQRAMQEYVESSQRDVIARTMKARDLLNDPVRTPDKERYWKNHSKMLFSLGVALSAAGGKDVGSIVAGVNDRIAQDIQEQKDQFEEPRKRAEAQIKANDQIFAMLRNLGHDSYEATKFGEALYADQMSAEAKRIAASSESALRRANAAIAAAAFDQKAQQDYTAALEHNRTYAVQRAQTGVSAYNAQTERMRAMQAGGKTGAEPVPEQPLQKLANIPTALDSLGRLFQAYKDSGFGALNKNSQYDLAKEAEAGSMAAGITPNARENAELMKDFKAGLPTAYTRDSNGRRWFEDSARAMIENADNQIKVLENSKKYDKGQIGTLRKEVDDAKERLLRAHPELGRAMPTSIPTSPPR
jgi:hypothetical protein